ncbi:uncharacterized protein YpmS [Catalinimonas alkaloidigena]|nr:uncharacterized protein YpmS [Catalinimonas alkaloidigena]
MKNNSLYNRIYEHSFSLLLTFSFYVLIFAFLLSCEDEQTSVDASEIKNNQVTTSEYSISSVDSYLKINNIQGPFGEK